MTDLTLDFDYAPSVWTIGPTDDRPFDLWLPGAIEETLTRFELPTGPGDSRDIVTEILTRIGQHEDIFDYFVIHWPSALDQPTPLYLGLHVREGEDVVQDWLDGIDLLTVEPPVTDEIEVDREGVTLRRSIPYSTDDVGEVLVSARYVVDTGHPEGLALARTASYEPGRILAMQQDVTTLLATVRLVERGDADA